MNEATMEKPHTFDEGKQYLAEGHGIDYEVAVQAEDKKYLSQGALMTREAWLAAVKDGSFIDYDGYGDQLTAEGKFIGANVSPSRAFMVLPETAYILWYNR